MVIQFGKNPEITLSVIWNIYSYSGWISLPFSFAWWCQNSKSDFNLDISFWILGLRFGLEIWKWKK